MKKKHLISRIVGLALAAALALPGASVFASALPEGAGLSMNLEQHGGIVMDMDNLPSTSSAPVQNRMGYPDKYDLREKGFSTPVKFQNPWGACWAFAGISSVESNLLSEGKASAGIDLSEKAATWFTYQAQNTTPENKEGTTIVSKNANELYDAGGNFYGFGAQLSTWYGASTEKEIPYQGAQGNTVMGKVPSHDGSLYDVSYFDPKDDWSVPYSQINDNAYHLEDMELIMGAVNRESGSTDMTQVGAVVNAFKDKIMSNGAVAVMFNADESKPEDVTEENPSPSPYFKRDTSAYYHDTFMAPNHGVSIVGWDDTFTANSENFTTVPPGAGAWIVKNSWSDKWGTDGYFYLSYYDATMTMYASCTADSGEMGLYDYDNNYQYDYLGNKNAIAVNIDTFVGQIAKAQNIPLKVANIFTADKAEVLKAVSLTANDANATVTTEIYRVPDTSSPISGAPVYTQEDTFSNTGYYTLELRSETPISLKAGEHFSVVQTITYPDHDGVPIEIGLKNAAPVDVKDKNGQTVYTYYTQQTATNAPGQSFVYGLNTLFTDQAEAPVPVWKDITDETITNAFQVIPIGGDNKAYPGNVMIKAFTVDQDTAPAVTLGGESFDAQGQSLGSQNVTDLAAAISLPKGAAAFSLSAQTENGEAVITVGGEAYEEGTKLDAAVLNTPGAVTVDTTSAPRGNNGAHYVLNMAVTPDTPSGGDPGTGEGSGATPPANDNGQNVTSGGKNVGTGLFDTTAGMGLTIAAVLLLAASGGFILYRRNRKA